MDHPAIGPLGQLTFTALKFVHLSKGGKTNEQGSKKLMYAFKPDPILFLCSLFLCLLCKINRVVCTCTYGLSVGESCVGLGQIAGVTHD